MVNKKKINLLYLFLIVFYFLTVEFCFFCYSGWRQGLINNGNPIDFGAEENAWEPDIAFDHKGNAICVFQKRYTPSEWRIHASYWDGKNWSLMNNNNPIDSGPGRSAGNPSIAFDSQNNAICTFNQISSSGYSCLYASHWKEGETWKNWDTDGTNTWNSLGTGDALYIINPSTASVGSSAIVFNQNDYLICTFVISGYIFGGYWNRQVWNSLNNGNHINPYTGGWADLPAVDFDKNSRVICTFWQRMTPFGNSRILASRWDGSEWKSWDKDTASWNSIDTGDPIDTGIDQHAEYSSIAFDDNGNAICAFMQFLGTKSHIYATRWDETNWVLMNNGNPIDNGTDNYVGKPVIVYDGVGNFICVFSQTDGSSDRVYSSRWDGKEWKNWDVDTNNWNNIGTGDPIDSGIGGSWRFLALDSDRVGNLICVYSNVSSPNVQRLYALYYQGPPVITSIEPNSGINDRIVNITNLSGHNFFSNCRVQLVKEGQDYIEASDVLVDSSGKKITCKIELNNVSGGYWDIEVINADGQEGRLENGFNVVSLFSEEGKIRVYPNPYIANKVGTEKIIFTNLPKDAVIRIYNVSGELINTIKADNSTKEWLINNVSSGVYIYYIDSYLYKKKGKISIIK